MKRLTPASIVSLVSLTTTLLCVRSASAQPVTGDIYLDNLIPANTTAYPSWSAGGISSGPTGLTTGSPGGFGSLYYALPTPLALNPNLTTATLVMTVNSPSASPSTTDWLGIPFILGDNTGAVSYGGYAGMFGYNGTASPGTATWNGNTVTETVLLGTGSTAAATQLAAIQAGGDYLYGFNLELDPAVLSSGAAYNVTFNSLTLSVPEPSSLALVGLCAGALLVLRSRKERVVAV